LGGRRRQGGGRKGGRPPTVKREREKIAKATLHRVRSFYGMKEDVTSIVRTGGQVETGEEVQLKEWRLGDVNGT